MYIKARCVVITCYLPLQTYCFFNRFRRHFCCLTALNIYSVALTFGWWYWLIVAYNSSVLEVRAIMIAPFIEPTGSDALLVTSALHVVHPYWKRAVCFRSKISICISNSVNRSGVIQHSAYNCSLSKSPVVVTDRSPFSLVINLNPSFVRWVRASESHSDI